MSVAEKSIQALAEAPRQPSEGTIDQVRELLFGETQRQNDTRAEDLQKIVDELEAKLSRRLDFLVISDHSDGYGMFQKILEGDPDLMRNDTAHRWHNMISEGGQSAVEATLEVIDLFSRGEMPFDFNDPNIRGDVWDEVIAGAERYNEPGVFTAFIGGPVFIWLLLTGRGQA